MSKLVQFIKYVMTHSDAWELAKFVGAILLVLVLLAAGITILIRWLL